jgi:uncharacterized Ntn-hydrolase superfamily protein
MGADVLVDVRVDDSPAPVEELARLLALSDLYFGTSDPELLLPLEGDLAAEVERRVSSLGFSGLEEWAGVENYEGRLVDGAVDPIVLEKLREATPDV